MLYNQPKCLRLLYFVILVERQVRWMWKSVCWCRDFTPPSTYSW